MKLHSVMAASHTGRCRFCQHMCNKCKQLLHLVMPRLTGYIHDM